MKCCPLSHQTRPRTINESTRAEGGSLGGRRGQGTGGACGGECHGGAKGGRSQCVAITDL